MKLTQKRSFKILTLITLVSILGGSLLAEGANSNGVETLRKTGKAFSAVSKKATPAVVAVKVRSKMVIRDMGIGSPFDDDFFERFFGQRIPRQRQPREQWREGQASGFIISADGYVMTNYHVIDGADEIKIIMSDGQEYDKVKVIGSDDKADVALLKIEDVENLPTVELGDSDDLEIGEWVIAIGNPFGLTETLTVGVVSALSRKVAGGEDVYQDFIQTDAAINPGNSGGPLLNLEGKVVGINSAIITGDRGYMGIGLAVPINMAKAIKDQLINTGKVQRGYAGIGLQDVPAEMAEFFKLENNKGAVVTNVLEDSPADKAGFKKDDVIIQIGGKRVDDSQDVKNIIGFTAPDTEVEVTIIRDGKEKKVILKVGSKQESELADTSDLGEKLGLTVQTITEEIADEYKVKEGEGVLITDVEQGSAADYKGLRKGMVILEVNGEKVSDVGEFNQALKPTEESKKAYLFVKVGRTVYYVTLRLDEK